MKVVDDTDEHQLVMRIAEGSEQAFTQFFDFHKNDVYGHALHFAQSVSIAEEITQDVFLKCWIKRGSLPEIVNLQAWLFTIAKNQCFNHLKKMAREHQLKNAMASANESTDENIESYLAVKEQQKILQQAIDQLSDQQKRVYAMNREGGMKNAEIAKQLNISPNTAKTHMVSALRSIRLFFKAHAESAIQVLLLFHLVK
ncbi:MAG: polymerase ECF-type sigma factor [Ferruginibacter sp.]|nr:polymerase ECF-type sigma factor [Ferruginibacter sp.]